MKILVVEDDCYSALFLRRLLERMGHEVKTASDGTEAWRIVREERSPVVISDWMMPGLNGLELFRKIREQVGTPYTYLILLSGKQSQQDRLEGLRAGADDFLIKPPDSEELVVRLEIARRILSVQEELERQNALLSELALSDELTGVKNRRRFREALDSHVSMAKRLGSPLSLVMLDVDHFKDYNDRFGHPAGDDALRAVAGALRENVRKHDEVARFGGEEFAILLPNTSADVATEMAERLRTIIFRRPWPLSPITVSLGVATTSREDVTPPTLLQQADRALYQSKNRGRDRVTHFRDLDDPAPPAPISEQS